jgi:Ni/Co efflux regulator RcnB
MERITLKKNCALVLVIAGVLAVGPAIAAKPSGTGDDKGGKSASRGMPDSQQSRQPDREARSPRDSGRPEVRVREHFGDQHRRAAQEYYDEEFRRGRCPPGLAKRDNGCLPPGLAKKWAVGRPLPRDVIFHHVSPALVTQFGPPPAGHRYVRVADDILLIGPGAGVVIDVIRGLGRM